MARSPASGRRCTSPFRSPKPSPRPTANSGAASGPTAAGAASSRRRPRPEAQLATPSPTSLLCARMRRVGGSRALLERGLQVARPVVFVQQIAKRLVGKLLERLHRVPPEQVQGRPSLLVELHELTPDPGRPLGHDDLLRWNNRRAASFTARGCDDARETAYPLSGREGARWLNHFAPAVAARRVHSWPRAAAPFAHRPRDPAFRNVVNDVATPNSAVPPGC